MTSYYNQMNTGENPTYFNFDQRTQTEKQKQHWVVQEILSNSIETLKIQFTIKSKINYQPRTRERVDLGQGSYCFITDNRSYNSKHTILTLHGAPGDHVEWAGLQEQVGNSFRWINFTFPGFDGQDERRGSYNGSTEHVAKMLLKLLRQLNVNKAIFCAHSMGSIFCSYFITNYPEVVQGYINLTGIVDHWYVGLMTFIRFSIAEYGYLSKDRRQKLWNSDKHRKIMHQIFLKVIENRSFGPVKFPRLTLTEYFAYIKLFTSFPQGVSSLYTLNKNLNIFRVLIFGQKDPLHLLDTTQASIYNVCRSQASYINRPQNKKIFSMARAAIQQRLKDEYNVQIDGSKLQEYFCFNLWDTGHNAHKRRPKEISRIIKMYTICLEELFKCSVLINSKL